MANPFDDPLFLAARKWRHSDEWLKAYYTIRAGHTERDAFAMARFAEFILQQRGLNGAPSEGLKQESALCQTPQVAERENGQVSEADRT